MTKQDVINDVLFVIGRSIIKAQSFTINKAIKSFKTSRLNERASQYTKNELIQIHADLVELLTGLDSQMYRGEIEWTKKRMDDIETSNL